MLQLHPLSELGLELLDGLAQSALLVLGLGALDTRLSELLLQILGVAHSLVLPRSVIFLDKNNAQGKLSTKVFQK